MDIFERDMKYFVGDVGVLDHLNLTLADDWLSPVSVDLPGCENGSVLIGAICGKRYILLKLSRYHLCQDNNTYFVYHTVYSKMRGLTVLILLSYNALFFKLE